MQSFPEPTDLAVPYEDMIGDGRPKQVGKWSVSNPHPGYGKDPNILNELGHTKYPMWVDSVIEGKRVVVNNPMEEAQHTGKSGAEVTKTSVIEPTKTEAPANKSPWG